MLATVSRYDSDLAISGKVLRIRASDADYFRHDEDAAALLD
jgi:hypothetical protein